MGRDSHYVSDYIASGTVPQPLLSKSTHVQTPSSGSIALLIQLTRRVYRRANEDVLGMKLKAYMVLMNLREGALPQADLCASMQMDANNTVLLLNYLEDLGFVERRRDPTDRRRHIVGPPTRGWRPWRALSAPWSRSRRRSSAR